MRKLGTITTAAAGAALVFFGGVAAVRQQSPPGLNVDTLASRLGLSAKAKARIAPQIDELNSLLRRHDHLRQEHVRLWNDFQSIQDSLARTLTPEQQRELHFAIARAWGQGGGMGPGYMGRMGGYAGTRMRGYMGGPTGRMGGYMGAPMRGYMRGYMGGPMGAHMGNGYRGGYPGRGYMRDHMGGYMGTRYPGAAPDTSGVDR